MVGGAGSWGIYTQGESPYELIGMMIDAVQCHSGKGDVDLEIVWPSTPPPVGEWPNVVAVSVRGRR